MKKSDLRKLVAGASVVVMAAGMAATIGTGAASAESLSSGNVDGKAMSFTRTVSGEALVDGTVTTGDEIQITNTIARKLLWLLYSTQDDHPACIEAVPNTSVWTVGGNTYSNDGVSGVQKPNEVFSEAGWVKIDATGGSSWAANPLTWTQAYKVNCAPGELNTGGLQWDSTGGSEKKSDTGPTIAVKAVDPGPGNGNGGGNGGSDGGGTGDGGNTPDAGAGSLGGLSAILGSLNLS